MSRAARIKGHSWERHVAIMLRKKLDPTARRNVEECQFGSVDIKTTLPLAIQCKALRNWSVSPHEILKQADSGNQNPGVSTPVGFVKIDSKKPLAIMYLDDFLKMFEAK